MFVRRSSSPKTNWRCCSGSNGGAARPDLAGYARSPSKGAARRGATIVEALLYLSVAAGVIAFTGQILQSEQSRQRDQIVALDVQMVVDATQLYVSQNYDTIVSDLLAGKAEGAPLVGQFGLERLVDAGFISSLFANGSGGLRGVYGQSYAVLQRATLRSDPTVTVNRSLALMGGLTGLTDGVFRETDGIVENDELDLEVVLVTTTVPQADAPNPRPIPPSNGSRIIELAGRAAIGYVPPAVLAREGEGPLARGAFNGWELSMTPYDSLDFAPKLDGGVIASIIALPVTGIVSVLVDARDRENLSRCAEIPENTAPFADCIDASAGNKLFSDIVFNAWDSDGNGTLDILPDIAGLHQLAFGRPTDTNNDRTVDAFPSIAGVQNINFAGATPIDLDENGNPLAGSRKVLSEMTNLFALSCHAADGNAAAPTAMPAEGSFEVNCPTTRLKGTVTADSATITQDLDVKGAATIGGTAAFAGDVTISGAATLASANIGAGGLIVGGPTELGDVTLNTGLSMKGVETDLLDNVPVWSKRLSFFFSAEEDPTTRTIENDTSTSTSPGGGFSGCPEQRPSQQLEYALIGYSMDEDQVSDDTINDTRIAQIAISEREERYVSVKLSGLWKEPITVSVSAQIFCR